MQAKFQVAFPGGQSLSLYHSRQRGNHTPDKVRNLRRRPRHESRPRLETARSQPVHHILAEFSQIADLFRRCVFAHRFYVRAGDKDGAFGAGDHQPFNFRILAMASSSSPSSVSARRSKMFAEDAGRSKVRMQMPSSRTDLRMVRAPVNWATCCWAAIAAAL